MQLSILLLAADRNAVGPLAKSLGTPGHGVTVVTRPNEAVSAAAGYSLLIIDSIAAPATVGDVITMLRAAEASATLPVLAIAHSGNLDETIALIEAGADEVIAKPFHEQELLARLDALALRSRGPEAHTHAIGDDNRHRLVAVFSPKGGVGTTTVATNLAVIAAESRSGSVLLVDLDLSFGQVASHLNLQPKQTLLELCRDDAALHETELFRTYVIHHASGLHVLASAPSPSFSALLTNDQIELVLQRALEAYDIVVVDAGTALDTRLSTLFSVAETVVVPVLPEIPALNSVHVLLEQLADTGTLGGRTVFVLNNAFARDLLKRSDIETALGNRISADLPYDPLVYLKAVNEGNPVVRGAPRSAPAEKLRALAQVVFGSALTPPSPEGKATKERRGLFGLGKR